MTTKITPEHEAWRKATAEKYARREVFRGLSARNFLAGMAAQDEVSRLIGALTVLKAALNPKNRRLIDYFLTENLEVAEARLAVLLANGKEKP